MARGATKGTNRFEAYQQERRSSIIEGLEAAFIIAKKSMLKFDSVTAISTYAAYIINNRGQGPVSGATLRKNSHYRVQLENFISKEHHSSPFNQGTLRVRQELEINELKAKIKSLESFISKNLVVQPTPTILVDKPSALSAASMLCQLIERLLAASEDILALDGGQIIRPYAISKAMRIVADQSLVSVYLEHRKTAALP